MKGLIADNVNLECPHATEGKQKRVDGFSTIQHQKVRLAF
jgi:hypothetical protein